MDGRERERQRGRGMRTSLSPRSQPHPPLPPSCINTCSPFSPARLNGVSLSPNWKSTLTLGEDLHFLEP